MKLKSLLLGSAAALVAVSGARAADAIVVEAEPMDYVRVCDTYGKGYFYIPGTETCLKLGGALRARYRANTSHEDETISDHNLNVRVRLNFDAKNETQYGTLTSAVRFNWQQTDFNNDKKTKPISYHDVYSDDEANNGGMELDYATISLAGFTVGYGTSRLSYGQWDTRTTAGDSKAFYLDYTFTAADLAVTVGVMDHMQSGAAGQPDPYLVAEWNGEGFGLKGFVVGDSSADNIAYGVIGDMDLSSFLPGGKLTAFWESDGDDPVFSTGNQTDYVKGHVYGVKINYDIMDKVSGYTRYSQYDPGVGGVNVQKWRQSVSWKIASGLKLEYRYNKAVTKGTGEHYVELTRSW